MASKAYGGEMVNLCRVTSTGILQLTHAQKKRRLVATRSITIKMKIKTHMASVVNVATKINKSRKENVKKERDSLFFIWRNFSFRVHDILVVYECHTRWIGHLLCAWESEKFAGSTADVKFNEKSSLERIQKLGKARLHSRIN